jgi:hypothetical protein
VIVKSIYLGWQYASENRAAGGGGHLYEQVSKSHSASLNPQLGLIEVEVGLQYHLQFPVAVLGEQVVASSLAQLE